MHLTTHIPCVLCWYCLCFRLLVVYFTVLTNHGKDVLIYQISEIVPYYKLVGSGWMDVYSFIKL